MLINVRIEYHKVRGGRFAGMESAVVPALVIMNQADGSTLVELQEAAFHYPKGYNIAVWSNDIVR